MAHRFLSHSAWVTKQVVGNYANHCGGEAQTLHESEIKVKGRILDKRDATA